MAFEILARLGLNSTGFNSGMKRAESSAVAFSRSLNRHLAGAFTIGAMVQFTRSTIAAGSAIQDTSDRLGISTKRVQELAFAAKQTGSDISGVNTAYVQLAKSIEAAKADGGGKDAGAFAALGVSASDLQTLNMDQIFDRIASRMKGMTTGSREMAVALEIFGKGGASILPMLVSGFDSLAAAAPVMRDETVKALDDIGDSVDELMDKLRSGFAEVILGPTSRAVNDAVAGWEAIFTGLFAGADRVIDIAGQNKTIDDAIAAFTSGFNEGSESSIRETQAERAARKAQKQAGLFEADEGGAEKAAKQAATKPPSPYSESLSSLQRIGAEIGQPGVDLLERQQLDIQRKMEKHLNDIRNSQDSSYP